jgi:HEPN domain-containing protein
VKQETAPWLRRAERNLSAAGILLREGFYDECVFFCHQSIEALLKGLWVEASSEGLPPRTHDLLALADGLRLPLSDDQRLFLGMLREQYTPTRYPESAAQYPRSVAEYYYERTRDLWSWLRQRLS